MGVWKPLFSIILLLLLAPGILATTYYVSSTQGADSNTGTNTANAWQTLDKVNGRSLSPGDNILFKRGDAWEGTLTVTSSGTNENPITYGAYGTGEKPIIYGSMPITGWTRHTGNIYKTTVSQEIIQLFMDGERMLQARTPNNGYHPISSVQSSTQFTANNLDSSIDYQGATWVGRTSHFTMYSKDITAASGNTLTLSSAPYLGLGVGEGFFLVGKLDFLDQAGEWHYDASTHTLYFWTPSGDSPANHEIRGSIHDYGVDLSDRQYVTIENLAILHSADTGVYASNTDHVTIDNNDLISPDLFGVLIPNSGSTYGTITNNYIYQANHIAIRTYSRYCQINDNEIRDTGLLENINRVLVGQSSGLGIMSREDYCTITYNRIINSGYSAINFWGDDTTADRQRR